MLPHLLLTLLTALPFLAGNTIAQDNQKLRIGDAAPDWKDLAGTDGARHSLADLSSNAVVVLCFTCNSCPYSVDYEDRLIALARQHAKTSGGVVVVAMNANRKPSETLEKMTERARQKNFPFLYLIDETQQVADSYGAVYTPEFFVLNKDRRVVYMGAMDDRTDATQVTARHVEDAISAALAGKIPTVTSVPARGCAIPFRQRQRR